MAEITVPHPDRLTEGGFISMNEPETRWWMLLWYFIRRVKNPKRAVIYKITAITSGTEFTINRPKWYSWK